MKPTAEPEERGSLQEQLEHLLGEASAHEPERKDLPEETPLPDEPKEPVLQRVLEKKPPPSVLGGKKIISVNLEGPNLRLVTFSGQNVTGWINLPFNPEFVRGGSITHPEELGEVIAALFRSWKLKGQLLCAFPGHRALSRLLSLPPIKKGIESQVVAREARRLLSYHPETQYLFWQPLPSKEGKGGRVYILTVPKEPLLSLVSTFKKAGKKPSRIELKLHALIRCLPRPAGIIVHCEPFSLEMAIVVDYIPVFMRSIYFGEEALPQDAIIERVVEEITATINFYREGPRELPLPEDAFLYLSGSLSEVSGLVEELGSSSGHPVQPLKAPLSVPPDFPQALFLINIGLFLGARP